MDIHEKAGFKDCKKLGYNQYIITKEDGFILTDEKVQYGPRGYISDNNTSNVNIK